MKSPKCLVIQLFFLLVAVMSFAQVNELESRMDTYLEPLLKSNNFSGFILIAEKGEIIVSKGYGYSDIELKKENSANTKFQIASLSKTFTATAVLLLLERGELKLSDPIVTYVPELENYKDVTIHHLLNHTSGIPDINRQEIYKKIHRSPQTTTSLIDIIKEFEPSFKPGEKAYAYSNSNYNILARIIEISSNTDYGDFLQRNFFEKLEMINSGHRGEMDQAIKNLAKGYVPSGGYTSVENAPYLDWSVKTGNGSLYSTSEDLLRWVKALMSGQVLSPTTLQLMKDNRYGWFVGEKLDEEVIYMNGSSPGYNGYFGYFPSLELTIVVLGNHDIALSTTIGNGLFFILNDQNPDPFPSLEPYPVSKKFISSIEGEYKFPYYTIEIIRGKKQISYRGGYPYYDVSMIPIEKNKLFNRFFWTFLILERDEDEKVISIHWEGNPNQKGTRVTKD